MTGSWTAVAGPASFEVRVRPVRETIHLQPIGELDLATSARLQAEIDELVAGGFREVVIDLRGLDFLDAAGLRLLLGLPAAAARDQWRLSVIQGCEAVRRLFTLTGTLERLPFRQG